MKGLEGGGGGGLFQSMVQTRGPLQVIMARGLAKTFKADRAEGVSGRRVVTCGGSEGPDKTGSGNGFTRTHCQKSPVCNATSLLDLKTSLGLFSIHLFERYFQSDCI